MAYLGGDWDSDSDWDDIGPLSHWKDDDEFDSPLGVHFKDEGEDDIEFSFFNRYKNE